MLRKPDELRGLVEGYLEDLALTPDLGTLTVSMRYALAGGGKRIRPVLCLATGDAVGAVVDALLPAAAAVELVHTFSLVHDDLPALDDDTERRGRASTWAEHGEATAILAGDALLAEALRLTLEYPTTAVAQELVAATLGMIGGQQLDLEGGAELELVNRLKTGALLEAAVMCGLHAAQVEPAQQGPWRAFAVELGALFQLVDDLLDGDGSVLDVGEDATRRLVTEAAERAQARLVAIPAETRVLAGIVSDLAVRTG
jgi:geranylgeranyl diphosphate synthase, type II